MNNIRKLLETTPTTAVDKWRLAMHPEDYKYSSAKFYLTGVDDFGLLTHYNE